MNDTRSILKCDVLSLLLTALFFVYTSPNVLSAILLICALTYWIIDVIATTFKSRIWVKRIVRMMQITIVLAALSLFVILPTVYFMVKRAQSTPVDFAQDSLVQIEAAAQFVLAGKNPYVENYLNTPLSNWNFSWAGLKINPALDHFAYTPLAFLLAVPGEGLIRPIFQWYDHRMILILSYVINLLLINQITDSRHEANALMILIGLNPLLLTAYTYGNLDSLVITGWLYTYFFAIRQHWKLAFLSLGCAIATKQIAVVPVPFLFTYWLSTTVQPRTLKNILTHISALVTPLILFIGPFALWHPYAFLEDTVLFITGNISDSWPVSGMSLQALLPSKPSLTTTLFMLRLIIPIPLLALTCHLTWNLDSIKATLALQMLYFTVLIFLGRFVNAQYIGYILILLGLSLWIQKPNEKSIYNPVSQKL